MSSAPNPTITVTLDQMRELIKEFKKPTAEEADKLAKAKELELRAAKTRVEMARIEEQEKKRREDSCSHRKPNGESTVMGQRHSDGKRHPICLRCQKEFKPTDSRAEDEILSD